MTIKNTKIYDFLKWLGRYCLPALSAFAFTLSEILSVHDLAIVSAVISAVVVMLNSMLGVSNENFNKDDKKGWKEYSDE